MANRKIEKVPIDGADLKKAILDARYSIRSLAEKLDRNDRTIRIYLDRNEMPVKLYRDICNLIGYEGRKKMTPEELKRIKDEALHHQFEPITDIYHAPIFASISEMQYMVNEEYNNQILRAVGRIGIEIDEQGLVKALNADRERYEQAYCEGYAACKKEYEAKLLQIAKLTGYFLESEE